MRRPAFAAAASLIAAVLAAVALLSFAMPAAAQDPPPKLDLVMTPHATGGDDSYLGVQMTLQAPTLKTGDGLVRLPLRLVGIPTARYDGDALTARDDQGPIPLTQSEEPPTPQGVYRRWSVGRATVGDVVVSYRAPPRRVTAATNNGPLFDLREEAGGFIGAGVGFLAAPVAPGPWRVKLTWDAPAGFRGVWSLGEGTVETVLPSEAIAFSYYTVGPLKSYPTEPDPHFGLYWLADPPFAPAELGDRVRALYASMAKFFDDEGGSYRVFVRQNPFKGQGGTALARSFTFGYHAPSNPTVDGLQGLVAHEMAHTWPALQGEHGDTAWYSEGMAEFYALALSYRAGAIPVDRVLTTLNERADAYYSNPYVRLSNPEAAKKFWTDPIAQKVPYGRGFLYLLQTDFEIRKASGGKRSLDDVAKALRKRQVADQPYGIPQWLELVGAEIGLEKAQAGYDHMVSGGLLIAPAQGYAPCLTLAKADIRKDDELRTPLTLRRGETQTTVSLPRAAPVEAYRWARDPNTPATACRF